MWQYQDRRLCHGAYPESYWWQNRLSAGLLVYINYFRQNRTECQLLNYHIVVHKCKDEGGHPIARPYSPAGGEKVSQAYPIFMVEYLLNTV